MREAYIAVALLVEATKNPTASDAVAFTRDLLAKAIPGEVGHPDFWGGRSR